MLFNQIRWSCFKLGEEVMLLECSKETSIEKIHESSHSIEKIIGDQLIDIVPAYHSIAIFTTLSMPQIFQLLRKNADSDKESGIDKKVIELPICYETGMDLDRVANESNLSAEEVISMHLKSVYRSLFIGFTPGFIYADGLDEKLTCPRLDNPRKNVPSGSVGIAGSQTGIYSLESPGGWNIIGRTPAKIFDPNRREPMLIGVGMKYRFFRITKAKFESWEN
ncbi:MAG: 5-oxoprolinase subunit PxpB [Ekhidna sp.]